MDMRVVLVVKARALGLFADRL
eukprot:SAG31_NODE_11275_length_1047_cov_0.866034_1_plen_21_part_10